MVGVAAAFGRGTSPSIEAAALSASLLAAASVLALVGGMMSLLAWRLTGDTASLFAGLAVSLLGIGALAFGGLAPIVAPGMGRPSTVESVRLASLLVIFWLLGRAVTSAADATADDDADRVRLGFLVVRLTVALGGLVALLQLLPGLGFVHGASDGTPSTSELVTGASLVAAWATLGTVYAIKGLRNQRWLHTWFGLMLFGLALAELTAVLSTTPNDRYALGAAVLTAVAVMFALNGASEELQAAFWRERAVLRETRAEALVAAVGHRAHIEADEERAHDARSAVVAIEGAVRQLERSLNGAGDHARTELTESVIAEISRLQALINGVGSSASRPFDLRAAVNPVIKCQRSDGLEVRGAVPDGVIAFGRPGDTAQVLGTLLDNARQHAPGSPVTLSAATLRDEVRLWVSDRGPGIPDDEAESVFGRTTRGPDGGDGLGLYVARRIMRHQHGELRTEPRVGGGQCFVVSLSRPRNGAG